MTTDSFIADQSGRPIIHRTLSLYVQLETLELEDVDRITAVNRIALDWVGGQMRWALASMEGHVNRFNPSVLEYVETLPEDLDVPSAEGDPELAYALAAGSHDKFLVFCHGNPVNNQASPWGIRWLFEIDEQPAPDVMRLQTCGFFRIDVPFDSDLTTFERRVDAITNILRLRWAVAGLSYAGWDIRWNDEIAAAIYKDSRRRFGYDAGFYAGLQEQWHHEMRTVSWLTWIGPALASRLPEPIPEGNQGYVTISRVGDKTRIRAGHQPSAGDVNRLQIPHEYVLADQLVRPVRASEVAQGFGEPFSESKTREWLQRFQRRSAIR